MQGQADRCLAAGSVIVVSYDRTVFAWRCTHCAASGGSGRPGMPASLSDALYHFRSDHPGEDIGFKIEWRKNT